MAREREGETVLIHDRLNALAVRSLTPLSLFSTRETVDFPRRLNARCL
jgi:hypothetical protein